MPVSNPVTLSEVPWTPAPLVNGFVNWNGGLQVTEFRLRNKAVELRGICRINATSANETLIFTLPPACCPPARIILPLPGNIAGAGDNFRVDVYSDGRVVLLAPIANMLYVVMLSCSFFL